MGANAQRRRALRLVSKNPDRVEAPEARRARILRRNLAAVAAKVTTLEAFATLLIRSKPHARDRLRAMLWPLLPENLPCCARSTGSHTPGCQAVRDEIAAELGAAAGMTLDAVAGQPSRGGISVCVIPDDDEPSAEPAL